MWQPGTALRLVDTEALQTSVQVGREPRRPLVRIAEDEHADAARLAVAPHFELRRRGAGCGRLKLRGDGVDVGGGPRAEECERDVQVLSRHLSAASEGVARPP